jgi:hypothetical protein
MLADIFLKRYPEPLVYGHDGLPASLASLLGTLTHVALTDLQRAELADDHGWRKAHDQLARELGIPGLAHDHDYFSRCARYLTTRYELWNDSHRSPDFYFKTRLSLIELLFRSASDRVTALEAADKKTGGLLSWNKGHKPTKRAKSLPSAWRIAFDACVAEMNSRFVEAKIPLHYHAGVIQLVEDTLSTQQISEPFWEAIRPERWQNVSTDMKEAIDRRDSNDRDAALYAMKALESAIKIVSDEKGWTRGKENGAAGFIDNLVSEKNGRFIDVWESKMLKDLFGQVRNPHGHGPGSAPMPELLPAQQTWVIESAMSWIKSLLHRIG